MIYGRREVEDVDFFFLIFELYGILKSDLYLFKKIEEEIVIFRGEFVFFNFRKI